MNTLPHWWQNGVIYQIYPKSFQDTTGSGTGDLRGVTQRLDYLKTLGVDAIWLTPFYISPQVDNGYDVANYTAIDPAYGTLDDFDELVAEANARGIRIVLDMVFNHTSTQHAWFRESLNKESPYRQFYIWRDGNRRSCPTTGAPSLAATPGAGTPRASSIICTCSPRSRRISTGKTRRCAPS
jgi:trehalose-6-phosphate hydrolase